MAQKNLEIEVKLRVENITPLLAFLEREALKQGESRQIDEYFTPAHKNYLDERPVLDWLRLREEEGACSINFKHWHIGEKNDYCDEYQTSIGSMEQARLILTAMGCRSLGKVDKFRRSWRWQDFEIAVDQVEILGNFVEIEYVGEIDVDPDNVVDEMLSFMRERDCGLIERNRVGYPFMVLFPEEVTFEII